jgi:AraC family ethanolamine operon transcriptional activator
MNCLTAKPWNSPALNRGRARVMARFQETLSAQPDRLLSIPEICRAIEASEQTLRVCCAKVLGMGPGRYQRLRRLKRVRMELRAMPAKASFAEITRRFGFADPERFAAE